jgi:hypothetical protein
MGHARQVVSKMRSKRRVYVTATLITMGIFVPFQHHAWAPYVATCVGYTVLVFGLRRLELNPRPRIFAPPSADALRSHATYLSVAILWVWLLIRLSPRLPYILRTEDTNRPYFGLAFIGILGLLLLEALEQRSLRRTVDEKAADSSRAIVGAPES